jgi:hypothetical protein
MTIKLGIDDQNGIAIIDLSTYIKQWFIDNSEKVLDMSLKKSRITNSNSALSYNPSNLTTNSNNLANYSKIVGK